MQPNVQSNVEPNIVNQNAPSAADAGRRMGRQLAPALLDAYHCFSRRNRNAPLLRILWAGLCNL
jgi:hypothetical protein